MTYTNTFIQVAEDCPALHSVAPVPRGEVKPVHVVQDEYKHFVENTDGATRLLKAMRSKRA